MCESAVSGSCAGTTLTTSGATWNRMLPILIRPAIGLMRGSLTGNVSPHPPRCPRAPRARPPPQGLPRPPLPLPAASREVTPATCPVPSNFLPSEEPSSAPSVKPSGEPSMSPSVEPSGDPSSTPSDEPSMKPSTEPSIEPSAEPSDEPNMVSREVPSVKPSDMPSPKPLNTPLRNPSTGPQSSAFFSAYLLGEKKGARQDVNNSFDFCVTYKGV